MRLRFVIFVFVASALILSSCAPENSQVVVAKFGNQKITMKQFENAYKKNVGEVDKTKQDSLAKMKNFLDLYTNFRMKLRDAYVRGFGQDKEMQDELNDYKKKVGITYYLEKKIVDPGIHQLYNRRKWELRVSHIMIRPDSANDFHAKELAESLIDSLNHGANFAELASKYSQDQYSKKNGGDIYYVTAGQLPPSFEDAAYNTEVGHIYPHVVKTKFGYHIIKVTEKRKREPEIKVSHILARFMNNKGKFDSTAARQKIDSAMTELKKGVDFAKVAHQYSDDTQSAKRGGDLGYFPRRTMVKPFDEAAFNLKKVGDISGIVRSRFGYHIIKLTAIKPYPSFEEDKAKLSKIFKQTRYQGVYDSLLANLKKEYNFELNKKTFNQLEAVSDTLTLGQKSPALKQLIDLPLFTYSGKTVDVGEFFNKAKGKPELENKKMTSKLLKDAVDKVSDEYILDEKVMNLDKTDPEFASLMKDYKDGIYIFKLQQDEVWNKIKLDSTKLHAFYQKTKGNYIYPDRVDFNEIFVRKVATAKVLYDSLENGADFTNLAKTYTERPGYKQKEGSFGLKAVNSSELSRKANGLKKPGDFSEPFKTSGGYSIVELVKKEPSRIKTFKEAKPEVSAAYQDEESKRLENNYIESLTKLYHPVKYYDKLEEAFKSN